MTGAEAKENWATDPVKFQIYSLNQSKGTYWNFTYMNHTQSLKKKDNANDKRLELNKG